MLLTRAAWASQLEMMVSFCALFFQHFILLLFRAMGFSPMRCFLMVWLKARSSWSLSARTLSRPRILTPQLIKSWTTEGCLRLDCRSVFIYFFFLVCFSTFSVFRRRVTTAWRTSPSTPTSPWRTSPSSPATSSSTLWSPSATSWGRTDEVLTCPGLETCPENPGGTQR